MTTGTLHMLCGMIAAGKSTLAARLADEFDAVLVAEDTWLALLFGDEIQSIPDYVDRSARLRRVVGPLTTDLLRRGTTVILDFPANTAKNRQWMKRIIDDSSARHILHWLDTPIDVCRARLRARNARGDHDFAASDAEFDAIAQHFQAPRPEEGFTIERYAAA